MSEDNKSSKTVSEDQQKKTKMVLLVEKFKNFKQFVKENANNKDQIKEYENMSIEKLIIMSKIFFIPFKNSLDDMVEKIIERCEMNEQCTERVKKYLECFIELLEDL